MVKYKDKSLNHWQQLSRLDMADIPEDVAQYINALEYAVEELTKKINQDKAFSEFQINQLIEQLNQKG